jgi:hypothetical protein
MLKPKSVRVLYPDNTSESLFMDYSVLVYDILDEIKARKPLPADIALYMNCKDGGRRNNISYENS